MQYAMRWLLAALFALCAMPAHACTLCHSDTARAVRHRVLGHDFAANLMALALPLPLLLAAIHLAGRDRDVDEDA